MALSHLRKEHKRTSMIPVRHLKNIESANLQLARSWEQLKKTHATGNTNAIEQAEMSYLQAVQRIYTACQEAVAEKTHTH